MAIADVAGRLYSSSAYRNTPVIKALADSVKMNLKFRFSLVGMAAALTGSQTLYQIAQQKYLITDEEKKQAKEEIVFKKYVVTSISTLSKQVALIESIVEKNSLMINAIYNDLGYFKGQRKYNASLSYGAIKSFRAPINTRTVKGKIDLINAEIAALKGIRIGDATANQKAAAKQVEARERDKTKGLVGAAVGATLATIGSIVAGGGVVSTAALAGIGGIAGAYVSSKVVEQAVKTAIPIIGQAFKISLGLQLAKMTLNYSARKMSGETGVNTGDKNLDKALDPILSPIVDALNIFLLYMGLKGFKNAKDAIKKGKSGRGSLSFLSRISKTAPTTAAPPMASAVDSKRVWTGKMWKTVSTGASVATPTAARKTKLPKSVLKSLAKLNKWAKGSASKLKLAGAAILLVRIGDMYSASEQYESDTISYSQYKERMVDGYKQIIGTIGATGVGAALGSMVGGPIGFVVGALGGYGAGLLLEDPTTSAAIKLFNILHGIDSPESGVGYTTPTSSVIRGSTVAAASLPSYSGKLSDSEGNVSKILATIRLKESNNNYKAQNPDPDSTASGAYQFIDGTWASLTKKYGIGTEYTKAKDAPPQIQDAVAELYVNEILIQTNGDVSKVPLVWFTGNPEGKMSAAALAANKGMTGETYQASWLGMYSQTNPSDMATPMLAGAGLGSMLDAQIFELIGKDFSNVSTLKTDEQVALSVDNGARASVAQLTEVVIKAQKKNVEQISAVASAAQQIQDQKNLDTMPYVDDRYFDEEFSGLSKVS